MPWSGGVAQPHLDRDHAPTAGGAGAAGGLIEAIAGVRDRLVSSDRFRRWAARFPPTRPVARRRTRELFDLCAGFVYSQILGACVELNLFDILAEGAQTAESLARRLDLPTEATTRLLHAATALRLVSRRGGDRFGLGPLGAAMVGNIAVTAMVAHHHLLYADLADPVTLLRGRVNLTRLAKYWSYARSATPAAARPDEVGSYTELMAASQPMVAAEILDAYTLGQHRCLLDVGGGDGAFLAAAARRAPALQLMLFDLPSVAARARSRFEAAGLADRTQVFAGSFLVDTLPNGADLISLVRVVHDHDDAAVRRLLRAVHAALPVGGTLLLAEPMADTAGAQRMGDAYFGFYLLAMGSGQPRSATRLTRLLHEAGFTEVQTMRTSTPLLTGVLIAKRTDLVRRV